VNIYSLRISWGEAQVDHHKYYTYASKEWVSKNDAF